MYKRVSEGLPPDLCAELVTKLHDGMDLVTAPTTAGKGHRTTDMVATKAICYPYFKTLIPGRWMNSILVLLFPHSKLPEHSDSNSNRIRHHVALQTNPGVRYFHDGVWQQLELGVIYTMNPSKTHAAVNKGDTLRIQLFVDVPGPEEAATLA